MDNPIPARAIHPQVGIPAMSRGVMGVTIASFPRAIACASCGVIGDIEGNAGSVEAVIVAPQVLPLTVPEI